MQQPPIPAGASPSLLPHPTRSASALHAKPLAAPSWETSSTADPSASLSLAPAFSATLRMLEWPRLCEYLAEFASTHAGRRECLELSVPSTAAESQRLLDETRSLLILEYDYFTALDFGGISTAEAEAALKRAAKGGMCSPGELRGAASLFEGAAGLRRQITAAARANDALGTRDGPLAPLLRAVAALQPGAVFCREVRAAIDDEGRVADAASEALAGLRARVRAVQQRLNGVLRGLAGGVGGEVSDQAGRMCLAVTAGVKLPPGSILLGSSTGGSILYVEPSAAVALNNELGGAKAQAASAEEDVLYALTGRLMGVLEEAQQCLQVVTWLDVLSAKARFGIWMGAKLPELVPWEQVFHARGAAARRAQQKLQQHNGGSNGKVDPADDPDARFMVRLRSLRHPLLYCAYLKQRQVLERQAQMEGSTTAGGAGGTARWGRMRLSNRKEAMMNDLGLKAPGSDGQPSEGALSAQAQLSALRAPRPIDVLVRCETSAVVVTGPNTGGKTAAMKALGLTALMARAGLAVPAEEPARLPAFSSVLADIGDEQSLTANLSTFSGHLRRIQALRAEADGKALILLDELGTGTDPTEGAALGVALLRRLVNGGIGGGALTMATTHHSIMTGLKFEDPRFENACVEFDEEALAPTYKLLWGIPGRSNALNIASRLGLDPDLIEAARRLLDTSTTAADAAIAELEALQSQAERDEMAAWAQEQEVKRLEREVERHEQRVDAKREELGTARRNSLFGVWQRAQDRLKAVKSLMKKYKQGALPPGVTVPSLLLEQQAGGGGGGSENGKLKTVEEVWNEVDRLAGKGQAAEGSGRKEGRKKVAGDDGVDGLEVEPMMIEDYVRADAKEFFGELVSEFEAEDRRRVEGGELEEDYEEVVQAVSRIMKEQGEAGERERREKERRREEEEERRRREVDEEEEAERLREMEEWEDLMERVGFMRSKGGAAGSKGLGSKGMGSKAREVGGEVLSRKEVEMAKAAAEREREAAEREERKRRAQREREEREREEEEREEEEEMQEVMALLRGHIREDPEPTVGAAGNGTVPVPATSGPTLAAGSAAGVQGAGRSAAGSVGSDGVLSEEERALLQRQERQRREEAERREAMRLAEEAEAVDAMEQLKALLMRGDDAGEEDAGAGLESGQSSSTREDEERRRAEEEEEEMERQAREMRKQLRRVSGGGGGGRRQQQRGGSAGVAVGGGMGSAGAKGTSKAGGSGGFLDSILSKTERDRLK